ncbi:MAG: YkgJ family cysteine cluster protein [Deltaproteobacteria bacterium]|nr:YkgJ family cysteine cluster protein [Deltaproteobacteria bacterium]
MGAAPDLTAITALHRQVDEQVAALTERHGPMLHCGQGCTDCCVDDLTVFQVEAARILGHHAQLLAEATPRPPGACAFLDGEGACRIYADRPYVCRTQGLPLRWIDDGPDGQPAEHRDICTLNDPGPELIELPAEACWTLGPVEIKLQALQLERGNGELTRVALRSLFARSA